MGWLVTDWSRYKMADIFQTTCLNSFAWMKPMHINSNFAEIASQWSHYQLAIIGQLSIYPKLNSRHMFKGKSVTYMLIRLTPRDFNSVKCGSRRDMHLWYGRMGQHTIEFSQIICAVTEMPLVNFSNENNEQINDCGINHPMICDSICATY